MDISKQIEYWKNGAINDIDSAELLIKNGKYLHGLFFCHLVIEKIIKAHVAKDTGEVPPKSHNIIWLVDKTKIKLLREQRIFLGKLMIYQIEGRYPEYYPENPTKTEAIELLNKTNELLKWFREKL